jgi:hypothetical protein
MWEQLFEVVELRVIDLIIVIMLFMVSSLVLRSSDRNLNKKRRAEILARLIELKDPDNGLYEGPVHVEADKLLCEVLEMDGHGEIVSVFNALHKWYE